MKTITMTLDPASIDKAIKELETYKKELRRRINELVTRLVDEGVTVAKVQIAQLGASYTGELSESIGGYFNSARGVGVVYCGAWYGVFVEFGTGVVGAGSPHPAPNGWKYDVNSHGDAGWWYFNDRDGKWHWTKGVRSKPFMYITVMELERQCERIAREVFG